MRTLSHLLYRLGTAFTSPAAVDRSERAALGRAVRPVVEALERKVLLFAANVNFQQSTDAAYSGYLVDGGQAYGSRGNGYTYGWNVDNTANARDRNHPESLDQRYDTFNHMQSGTGSFSWEMAVPNGTYQVRVMMGDALISSDSPKVNAEAVLAVSGRTYAGSPWWEGTAVVAVADGRLTLSNATGASGNKIAFAQIRDLAAVSAVPAAPTGFTATRARASTVDLRWSDATAQDAANAESSFVIERKTGAGGTWADVLTAASNRDNIADTTLTGGTTYVYRIKSRNARGDSAWSNEATVTTPTSSTAQQAYLGTPTLPGAAVEGENYDVGGEGVSWNDSGENQGQLYRWGSMDVVRGEGRAGHAVGFTQNTEWVEYTANVASAGDYRLDLRVSSRGVGGTFHVESNGVDKTGPVTVPDTGSYYAFTTVSKNLTLAAGTQVLRFFMDAEGSNGRVGHFDKFSLVALPPAAPSAPSGLTAAAASSSQINLAWSDNSSNETGFRVERSADGGASFAPLATLPAGATAYSDTGLSPSTAYTYRVRAYGAAGDSAWSGAASATTQAPTPGTPAAPSGLTAAAASSTRVDLVWADNSNNEGGFHVERREGAGAWRLLTTVNPGITAYADTGLAAETAYAYRVSAAGGTGVADSAYSSEAVATTAAAALGAPLNLSAVASGSSIALNWTDNSANEDGFVIEGSVDGIFSEIARVVAGATAYSVAEPIPNMNHQFRVRAHSVAGSSRWSNTAAAATRPDAPQMLVATDVSTGQIELSWHPAGGLVSYDLERKVGAAGTWQPLATLPGSASGFGDTGLTEGTLYEYRLRATNAAGASEYGGVAGVETLPAAPTGLLAVAASESQLDLTWTDNSASETGYLVELAPAGGGGEWRYAGATPAGGTSFSLISLARNTLYNARVRAQNGSGDSAPSGTATATTRVIPPAPSGVTATAASDRRIDVAWTDNSSDETSFEIELVYAPGTPPGVQRVTVPAGTTTYSATVAPSFAGISPTDYHVTVWAKNAAGTSWPSNIAVTKTLPGAGSPPRAPTGLTATQYGDTARLTWTPDPDGNIVGTTIEATAAGLAPIVAYGNAGGLYDLPVADPLTTYSIRVRTHNLAGYSGYSNTAVYTSHSFTGSVKPPATVTATPVFGGSRVDVTWDGPLTVNDLSMQVSTDDLFLHAASCQVTGPSSPGRLFVVTGLEPERTYYFRVRTPYGPSATAPATTLLPPPKISVEATKRQTAEGGTEKAQFTFYRDGGDKSKDVTVKFTLSGAATLADYSVTGGTITTSPVSGTGTAPDTGEVVIPAGAAKAVMEVTAKADGANNESTETLGLSIDGDPAYDPGNHTSATVQLLDITHHLVAFYGRGAYDSFGNQWLHKIAEDAGDPIVDAASGVSKVFNRKEERRGLGSLLQLMDADGDKVIRLAEAEAARVKVVGYSHGGIAAINFTRDLSKKAADIADFRLDVPVPVAVLVTLDPVQESLRSPGPAGNVLKFRNYYQTKRGPGIMTINGVRTEIGKNDVSGTMAGGDIAGSGINITRQEAGNSVTHEVNPGGTTLGTMLGKDVNHDTVPWYAWERAVQDLQ